MRSVLEPVFPGLLPFCGALVIGILAAHLCTWLKSPLPWMIGPLLATAAACMSGCRLVCPVQGRQAGQWVIGTALGLYFTPAVLKILSAYLGYIAAGVIFALSLGIACAWLLHRITGVDRKTAFFAMAIGGASEMAVQGEQHGAQMDRIAAAHSLRIMLVVIALPFALKFWGVHGLDPFLPATRQVHLPGLAGLILLTACLGYVLQRRQAPNAWVLGPLIMSTGLTACDIQLSALPQWIINGGQLLIGVSLGTRFTPAFLRAAPRYLGGVALCSVAAILLAAGFGFVLAQLSGIHPATAILATSPGGIAEMALTAKTLELGVPIVTAFHVVRMAVLVLVIGPLFSFLSARGFNDTH
ncbi:AbrB family transcriptional regulator [Noviherbaspirillum sedimenti]|uniref:AbrB family transcriptional regulator n=1 Tax=Noviherbaspirillum sedimenti TaxID=2320865 RepID=UPI003B75B7B4